ncbi:MAG: hypothetical protein KYX62_15880 [Pseudomonadota bacterium]|nr:hypothetical protein [Pseudomonadota bacterium]
MKKSACLLLFAGLLPLTPLQAESDAESEYQQWLKKTQGEFQTYLDENDKAFLTFLKRKWQPVDIRPADQRDPQPKPSDLPQAPEQPATPGPDTPVVSIRPLPQAPVPQPVTPPRPLPAGQPVAEFDFYGTHIRISYPSALITRFRDQISNQSIAAYWQQLATTDHKATVQQLQQQAELLGLNDWGTALLFDRFARSLQSDDTSRVLTSWFLLVKGGYDARVAYNRRIYLLLTSDQPLFGVTYFTLSGKRYYAINLNERQAKPGKVYTYEGQHEEGARPLDFSEPNRFALSGDDEQRRLSFRYDGQQYDISVAYPQRYVSYFSSYPQLSLPNYFRAGLPAVTADSLLQQLAPVVRNQSETEAVNRLLRFVQTAFAYKTDQDQFQEENYLFPLETLHYPYSDCEDRAALFAWLTESLLGLDVVILDYPGHVATAVAFDGEVSGDSWRYRGKRYVVADPTYINASAGMTMPRYAGVKPAIATF